MRKTFSIVFALVFLAGTIFTAQTVKATAPAIQVANFPVNISIPTWTPIGMTNVTGDGVWDGLNTVNGSSNPADFIMHYKKLSVGAHCPQGYTLGVDPANPTKCAQLTSADVPEHYIYAAQIVDVAGHCPDGYAQGVDPADTNACAKADAITQHIEHQTRTWVDTTYKQVIDVPAHCPTGYTATGNSDPAKACVKTVGYNKDKVYTFTDSHLVCPSGYSEHSGTRRKWEIWPYVYADKITETFTVNFTYSKSDQDPNKCHLPTGSSLNVPSWAMSDFNALPEWKINLDCGTPIYDYKPMIATTYKTVVDVDGHWGPWSDWTNGSCPLLTFNGTGHNACPVAPTTECQERGVDNPQTYSHADWVVSSYKCPDGYTRGLDTTSQDQCAKFVADVPATYEYANMVEDQYEYLDQEYIVSHQDIHHYWFQVWKCTQGSTCFNHVVRPGPDALCYIHMPLNVPGPISISQIATWCDVDPAYVGGYTQVWYGWRDTDKMWVLDK